MPRWPIKLLLKGTSHTDEKVGVFFMDQQKEREQLREIAEKGQIISWFLAAGSPFVFQKPTKRSVRFFFEYEWEHITQWNKISPSDAMYAVFHPNLRRIWPLATIEEDPIYMEDLLRRKHDACREVSYSGETCEEFYARGGVKTVLPAIGSDDRYIETKLQFMEQYAQRKQSSVLSKVVETPTLQEPE